MKLVSTAASGPNRVFLIAIVACLLAVLTDLLRNNLRQNKLPADKGGEGKGAFLGQIGQSAPDKFEQYGLRNVLLPRLALKPAAQLLIRPSGIHQIEVELIGLAYGLFGNFSCCAKVYFPLDAGISQAKFRLKNLGGIVEQTPPARIEEGVFLRKLKLTVQLET